MEREHTSCWINRDVVDEGPGSEAAAVDDGRSVLCRLEVRYLPQRPQHRPMHRASVGRKLAHKVHKVFGSVNPAKQISVSTPGGMPVSSANEHEGRECGAVCYARR